MSSFGKRMQLCAVLFKSRRSLYVLCVAFWVEYALVSVVRLSGWLCEFLSVMR